MFSHPKVQTKAGEATKPACLEDGNKTPTTSSGSDFAIDPTMASLNADSAKAERAALASRVYGPRAILMAALSLAGFAPLFHYFFFDGVWYYNAMYKERIASPKMVVTTSFHAFLGLAWMLLCLVQAFSGATRGNVRRIVHRVMGRYVGPVAVLALTVTACATDVRAMVVDPKKFSIPRLMATFGLSGFTLVSFALAYRAALMKDYATHKDMIVFSIMCSSLPGIERLFWYAMQAGLKCEASESAAARIQVRATLLIVMSTAFWRLGRFNRLNVAALLIFALSVLFEIPVLAKSGIDPCKGSPTKLYTK